MKHTRIIFLLLFILVGCPELYGQQNPASIASGFVEGKASDSVGNLLPGMTVIALDENFRREAMTDVEGKYRLELPVGNYVIRAGTDCIQTFYRENVKITGGKITRLDITISAYNTMGTSVSLYQLLATPEKYHNRLVVVSGYYRNASEESSLYATKDDADYINVKNSIWLNFDKDVKLEASGARNQNLKPTDLAYFDAKYILVEGIFDKNDCGQLGGSSGTIKNISRVIEMKRWRDGKREFR